MLTLNLEKPLQEADRLTRFNITRGQLPFLQRAALTFQQVGFSLIEIAELTNDGFKMVKSRLRYAYNNLSHLLGAPS